MARVCNGNHRAKPYYHEHRCECACGCKRDTVGYAFCVPCSFNATCGALRLAGKLAPHALSFYERRFGRGEQCAHPPDELMCGNLCGLCNTRVAVAEGG